MLYFFVFIEVSACEVTRLQPVSLLQALKLTTEHQIQRHSKFTQKSGTFISFAVLQNYKTFGGNKRENEENQERIFFLAVRIFFMGFQRTDHFSNVWRQRLAIFLK